MINKTNLPINEKYWKSMNSNQLDDFIKEIFDYYRTNGFPYYSTDFDDRQKDFNKLMRYDNSVLYQNNIIGQSMHGLGLAWSYFPHAFNVKSNGLNMMDFLNLHYQM